MASILEKDVELIEAVLQKVTTFVPSMEDLSYELIEGC